LKAEKIYWLILNFIFINCIEKQIVKIIDSIRHFFELRGFDVSSRLADALGMRATNVRLFFIYISFVTVGLSFGIYLTLAFLLRLKDMIYTKRSSVFDL
jgi:phage shock protein PspC (stress-responsive transcriptional regulator)